MFQRASIPSSSHHFRSCTFWAALTPLSTSPSTRLLKLSMPGWSCRIPARASSCSWAFVRFAFVS